MEIPSDATASSPPTRSDLTGERRDLYTARVDNLRGTSGQVRVHDGPVSLTVPAQNPPVQASPVDAPATTDVSLPTAGPATPANGFTPEQFMAMAWSTCLGETLRVVLAEHALQHESQVSVEVSLHHDPAGGYRFAPRALVAILGMPAEEAQPLVDAAHARCPVSKLLTGQGSPTVSLVGAIAQR